MGKNRNAWLSPAHQDGVKDGCSSSKSCESNPCPRNSLCIDTWRGYECKCDSGYLGDKCLDVCQMNPCKNNASCVHDLRSPKGYRCECSSREFSGIF